MLDIDKLIEELENNGVSKDSITKILDIITGKEDEVFGEDVSNEDTLTQVELALINEVDPLKKTRLAAKILSMRLEE